jgi:hypothetical protein
LSIVNETAELKHDYEHLLHEAIQYHQAAHQALSCLDKEGIDHIRTPAAGDGLSVAETNNIGTKVLAMCVLMVAHIVDETVLSDYLKCNQEFQKLTVSYDEFIDKLNLVGKDMLPLQELDILKMSYIDDVEVNDGESLARYSAALPMLAQWAVNICKYNISKNKAQLLLEKLKNSENELKSASSSHPYSHRDASQARAEDKHVKDHQAEDERHDLVESEVS